MAITQNGVLQRDDNDTAVMGGTSSADNNTIINSAFDPVTRRLLTDAASGSFDLTVEEDGGGTSVSNVDTIIFSGGTTVTDSGGGSVTVAVTGGGTVDTVVGTANRIVVDSTDPANPVVNISTNYVGQNTITTLGTITTGVWNGTLVAGQYGGTGVANTGKTMTIGGNFEIAGAFTFTGTVTGNTAVTFPTSGTLATTADIPANVVTAAATFATDESILRADGTSRGAQATSTNATLTDAGVLTVAGLATAAGFAPTVNSTTGNQMYLPTTNTLGWSINGQPELRLNATALSPDSDGGLSLGTTSAGFQNLFSNTGFTWNIENGDWLATHSTGILTVGTGDLRVTTAGTNTASVVTVGGTQTLTSKTLTSPTITTATLSGAQQLAEGASIRLDPTLSADGTYTGTTITGTAGATLAFGDWVYLAAADSRWELTDADAASTSGSVLVGVCVLAAAADGDPTVILLDGNIRADTAFPSFTISAPIYLSTTAGDVTNTAPSGTDDVVRIVGFGLTADSMVVNISPDYITIV